MATIKYSVVIPVYKNEQSIARLLQALSALSEQMSHELEAVFVVDGSPDQSYALLKESLRDVRFPAQLLAHSRNFGSFAAIRTGLSAARGEYFGVMAADLQEPPSLLIQFFNMLASNSCDVVVGTRLKRRDPLLTRLSSGAFWWLYRRLVVPDMPEGGVDIFGCDRAFRDHLLRLEESRSSLIALIFWLGFRREIVGYERLGRQEGKSGWSWRKKVDYMMDSIFAFTDLPIKLLVRVGFVGTLLSAILGALVFVGHLSGKIAVPGYAATMLAVLFFATLNLLAIGLVGAYAWRGYENSKQRPIAIVAMKESYERRNDE